MARQDPVQPGVSTQVCGQNASPARLLLVADQAGQSKAGCPRGATRSHHRRRTQHARHAARRARAPDLPGGDAHLSRSRAPRARRPRLRRGAERPDDAWDERRRPVSRGGHAARGHPRHRDDGVREHRVGHRVHPRGSVRLRHQAFRSRRSRHDHRAGHPAPRAARRGDAPPPRRQRAPAFRRDHRRERDDEEDVSGRGASGRDGRDRAGHRRERDRQGAGGACPPRA